MQILNKYKTIYKGCGVGDWDTIKFAYSNSSAAKKMLNCVNSLRESVYGTSEYNLTLDSGLVDIAGSRAEEISYHFNHTGLQENIAKGKLTLSDMYYDWEGSSGHYNNMIDKSATRFGFGVYMDSEDYSLYGVMVFE